jgi:hypothetical protein
MIKEYMEIGVKNDEHLIKLATVIQRLEAITAKGGDGELFDFDSLQELLEDSEEIKDEVKDISEESEDKE